MRNTTCQAHRNILRNIRVPECLPIQRRVGFEQKLYLIEETGPPHWITKVVFSVTKIFGKIRLEHVVELFLIGLEIISKLNARTEDQRLLSERRVWSSAKPAKLHTHATIQRL